MYCSTFDTNQRKFIPAHFIEKDPQKISNHRLHKFNTIIDIEER